MPSIMANRIQGFGTSIFTEMSALALQHGAVNLGQGAPDFAGPALLKQAAAEAIAADHNQYAPAPGVAGLREAVTATYHQFYNLGYDPHTETTVMSGATEALFAAMMALVNPGDEVIFFEPAYDCYLPGIVMAGGVPRPVLLHPPTHGDDVWRFDPDELRAAVSTRTRAILVNTPHNPTGKVFSRAELELIATLCQEHDIVAITDEVYDRLVFVGEHVPLATLPGMRERTITINSTGKSFSVTGWKIGYALTTPVLTEALRRAHQFITFATATPLQWGMAAAVDDALRSTYYADFLAFYTESRTLLLHALQRAGLQAFAPQGAYFALTILPDGWNDDIAFCRHLVSEIGVAAIPTSVFYSDPARAAHMARFCFAKKRETLEAGAERLLRVRQDLS